MITYNILYTYIYTIIKAVFFVQINVLPYGELSKSYPTVNSFIDRRNLLFYSTVMSLSLREAGYVIDGL